MPSPTNLVDAIHANVTTDWRLRENVRANLRRLVCRILGNTGPSQQAEEGDAGSAGTSGGAHKAGQSLETP